MTASPTTTTGEPVAAPRNLPDLDRLSDAELAEGTLWAYWATQRVIRWPDDLIGLQRAAEAQLRAEERFWTLFRAWLSRMGVEAVRR